MNPVKLSSKVTWVNRWEVESMSEAGKTYNVGQKTDGSWGCSCPRWIFSKARPRTDCKHIEKVKAVESPGILPIGVTHGEVTILPLQIVFYRQTRRHIELE